MLSTPCMPFVVSSNSSLTATMVCHHISTELKELALSMSLQGLCDSEIHEYTGISVQLIKRFHGLHCRTGNMVAPPPINIGRPCMLTAIQIMVCLQYMALGCHLIQVVTVPLQFYWAPGWHFTHRAANRASGSLQHRGVTLNNYVFPPQGGIHDENSTFLVLVLVTSFSSHQK